MELKLISILGVLLMVLYFGFKVTETLISFLISRKPKDVKSQFIADCYKIQMKYAKKGEYLFAECMNRVIQANNLPEEKPVPQTLYGEEIEKELANG